MKPAKDRIVKLLNEIAVLQELDGANVFKVNAFRNAARTLESVSESLEELVAQNKLAELKGFGKSILADVTEMLECEDGLCAALRELRKKIPAGLIELLEIEGFGPKKAAAVWQQLGVTTLEALKQAAQNDKLSGLPGFGAKTQEKILQGIERLAQYTGRHLAAHAINLVQPIFDALKAHPAVQRIEFSGSLRRSLETVKDVDIVVSTKQPEAVMQVFVGLVEKTEDVVNHGPAKSTIRLENNLHVDLRAIEDKLFPFTLHHFTGSKEHNVAMRGRAQKMGLKISEWGLFETDTDKLIPCKSEAEFFKKLGLHYIPPEIRENLGEIEFAEKKKIPRLIEAGDLKGIIHVHSTYSDGHNSIEEMARAAKELGFEYIAICDHSRSAAYAGGLSEEKVKQQHQEIDQLNKKNLGIRILKGIESDILEDGGLDYPEKILQTFDVIVASVHSRFNLSEQDQTRRIVNALKNKHTSMLGHATGRLLLGRNPYAVNLTEVIKAAIGEGKALELNCNSRRMDIDWRELKWARRDGLKTCINTDAHRALDLRDIYYGAGIARKAWCEKADVLNALPCDKFLSAIQSK